MCAVHAAVQTGCGTGLVYAYAVARNVAIWVDWKRKRKVERS